MKLILVLILSLRVFLTVCQSDPTTSFKGEGTSAYIKLPECNPLYLAIRFMQPSNNREVELSTAYNGNNKSRWIQTNDKWQVTSLSKFFPDDALKGRTLKLTSEEPCEWLLLLSPEECMLPGAVQETHRDNDMTYIYPTIVSCVLSLLLIISIFFNIQHCQSNRKPPQEDTQAMKMSEVTSKPSDEDILEGTDQQFNGPPVSRKNSAHVSENSMYGELWHG